MTDFIRNSRYSTASEVNFIRQLGTWSEQHHDRRELLLNYIFALKRRHLGFVGEVLSSTTRELLRVEAADQLDKAGG